MPNNIKAYPEWLERDDRPLTNEAWSVTSGPPARGEAWTDIQNRKMRIPTVNDDISRVIRAHEMMHAKVSPVSGVVIPVDLADSPNAQMLLTVCEEARVNHLIASSGYNTKQLKDGSEKFSGERAARFGDVNNITLDIVAGIGTGGLNDYISGVRKAVRAGVAKPEMLEHAMYVKKLAYKHIKREWSRTSSLASTEKGHVSVSDTDITGVPVGYHYTMNLAREINQLMVSPHAGRGAVPVSPDIPDGGKRGQFAVPILKKLPLTERVAGRLGRKRVATNIGRDPRRINRMLTDPERRVFDKRARNIGGVIVIDQSGSMRLDNDDIWRIIHASPGCTIIGYSHESRSTGVPNIWLMAERGRVAKDVPRGNGGNGVDGPALMYGLSKRRGREPFIWVCDGYVTDSHDDHHNHLAKACINLVNRHGIHMVPDVEGAIDALKRVGSGETLKTNLVGMLKNIT